MSEPTAPQLNPYLIAWAARTDRALASSHIDPRYVPELRGESLRLLGSGQYSIIDALIIGMDVAFWYVRMFGLPDLKSAGAVKEMVEDRNNVLVDAANKRIAQLDEERRLIDG